MRKKNPVLLSKGVADQVDTNKRLLPPFYRPNLFLSSFEIFGDPIKCSRAHRVILELARLHLPANMPIVFLGLGLLKMPGLRDVSHRSSMELSHQEETPRNRMLDPVVTLYASCKHVA